MRNSWARLTDAEWQEFLVLRSLYLARFRASPCSKSVYFRVTPVSILYRDLQELRAWAYRYWVGAPCF